MLIAQAPLSPSPHHPSRQKYGRDNKRPLRCSLFLLLLKHLKMPTLTPGLPGRNEWLTLSRQPRRSRRGPSSSARFSSIITVHASSSTNKPIQLSGLRLFSEDVVQKHKPHHWPLGLLFFAGPLILFPTHAFWITNTGMATSTITMMVSTINNNSRPTFAGISSLGSGCLMKPTYAATPTNAHTMSSPVTTL